MNRSTALPSLSGKRIFIVEDNPENLAIMRVAMGKVGAICVYDRWGTDTIQKLLDFKPIDLVLLDLMLPYGVSGYDIFDEMRCLPELAAVQEVIISASDPSVELPKAKAKGFSG